MRAVTPLAWGTSAAMALAAGCGTYCEEAAQICADEGRSSAVSEGEEPTDCDGALEAHAECIADEGSCAPAVVEACRKSAGLADEDLGEAP